MNQDDLKLFRQTYPTNFVQHHADWNSLIWALEKTVETNPEKWGWSGKACQLELDGGPGVGLVGCGEPAEYWDRESGYRCRDHFPKSQEKGIPAQVVGGYAGDLDGSGAYEHPWEKGERLLTP